MFKNDKSRDENKNNEFLDLLAKQVIYQASFRVQTGFSDDAFIEICSSYVIADCGY